MARTRVTVAMKLLYTSVFFGFVAEGFTPPTLLGAVRSRPSLHRSATATRDRRPAVHLLRASTDVTDIIRGSSGASSQEGEEIDDCDIVTPTKCAPGEMPPWIDKLNELQRRASAVWCSSPRRSSR